MDNKNFSNYPAGSKKDRQQKNLADDELDYRRDRSDHENEDLNLFDWEEEDDLSDDYD